MNVYAIAVERSDTGERDNWLWIQQAETPEAALKASDEHLRALGWHAVWRSVEARFLGTVDKRGALVRS